MFVRKKSRLGDLSQIGRYNQTRNVKIRKNICLQNLFYFARLKFIIAIQYILQFRNYIIRLFQSL